MTTNQKVLAGWLVLLAVALIYPVRYYGFSKKTVAPPPEFVSYQEALIKTLPGKIVDAAKAEKCRGYIIPVDRVERTSVIPDLPSLINDVNLALAGYDGWKLCVSEDTKKQMMQRAEECFAQWAGLGASADIAKNIRAQKTKAFTTNYSAELTLSPVAGDPAADVKLLLAVNNEQTHSLLFDVTVSFLHPETVEKRQAEYEKAIQALAALKNKAEFFSWSALVLLVAALAFVAVRIVMGAIRRRREKAYKDYLLAEIGKREELIKEGHYVTALELADKYLAAFPHDTEIAAFRRRLLDFTGNDPEMAQRAYVEHKKLLVRLKDPAAAAGAGFLLTQEEQTRIAPLLPYHPELKDSYGQLKALEDTREKERQEEVERELAGALEALKAGDLPLARELTASVHNKAGASKEAETLARRLESPAGTVFNFTAAGDGAPAFTIFLRDHLTVGRPDEGEMPPDVAYDDRRVSRRHLEVYKKGDAVAARDLGSAGGSFVNGQKIEPETETVLNNGDVITLGKIFDLKVDIGPGGLVLSGGNRNIVMLFSQIEFDLCPAGLVLPGKNIRAMRLDGLLVMVTGEKGLIPANGDEIRFQDYSYRLEVAK